MLFVDDVFQWSRLRRSYTARRYGTVLGRYFVSRVVSIWTDRKLKMKLKNKNHVLAIDQTFDDWKRNKKNEDFFVRVANCQSIQPANTINARHINFRRKRNRSLLLIFGLNHVLRHMAVTTTTTTPTHHEHNLPQNFVSSRSMLVRSSHIFLVASVKSQSHGHRTTHLKFKQKLCGCWSFTW